MKERIRKERQNAFIKRAIIKFGDKFDYCEVDYYTSKTPVQITCPVHDKISISPKRFLNNLCGCIFCTNTKLTEMSNPKAKEKFIEKAIIKFGHKFDYSEIDFVDSRTRVKIICPIHGSFFQNPENHLRSESGCTKCGRRIAVEKTALLPKKLLSPLELKERFIKRASAKFDGKFDYSKVDYVNKSTAVEIVCPVHGSIFVTPGSHEASANGCGKCHFDKLHAMLRRGWYLVKQEKRGE